MIKLKEISVFFPAYNEEANISSTVEKAIDFLPAVADKWEIIVVNDGSKDKTEEVVKTLIKKEKRISLINHYPNKGYGEAIKSGLYGAKYEWIFYTDSDGQFNFEEINNFIPATENSQIIVGFRINRQDSLIRKIFGWGWTQLSNILLGIKVKDVDCAFKLVKKEGATLKEALIKVLNQAGKPISPTRSAKVVRLSSGRTFDSTRANTPARIFCMRQASGHFSLRFSCWTKKAPSSTAL